MIDFQPNADPLPRLVIVVASSQTEQTRAAIELQSVETVSYTHLDVYKRQALPGH